MLVLEVYLPGKVKEAIVELEGPLMVMERAEVLSITRKVRLRNSPIASSTQLSLLEFDPSINIIR